MDLPSFELGTGHSMYKGFQYQNTKIELPKGHSLIMLHRCAGWPGSILVEI
jgi:hypothetical protein